MLFTINKISEEILKGVVLGKDRIEIDVKLFGRDFRVVPFGDGQRDVKRTLHNVDFGLDVSMRHVGVFREIMHAKLLEAQVSCQTPLIQIIIQ